MERAPQVIQAEPHLIIEVWWKNLLQLWTEDQCLLSEHGQRDTMLLVGQRDTMLLVGQRNTMLLVLMTRNGATPRDSESWWELGNNGWWLLQSTRDNPSDTWTLAQR